MLRPQTLFGIIGAIGVMHSVAWYYFGPVYQKGEPSLTVAQAEKPTQSSPQPVNSTAQPAPAPGNYQVGCNSAQSSVIVCTNVNTQKASPEK